MDVRSTWLFSYVNIFIAKYFFFLNFLVINALFNNENAGWKKQETCTPHIVLCNYIYTVYDFLYQKNSFTTLVIQEITGYLFKN